MWLAPSNQGVAAWLILCKFVLVQASWEHPQVPGACNEGVPAGWGWRHTYTGPQYIRIGKDYRTIPANMGRGGSLTHV